MRILFASILMLIVPILLVWIPVPGVPGLIGGLIGGYVAGTPTRAAITSIAPAVVLSLLAIVVGIVLGQTVGLSWLGPAAGGIALIWLVAHNVALLFGALGGGALGKLLRGEAVEELGLPRLPRTSQQDSLD